MVIQIGLQQLQDMLPVKAGKNVKPCHDPPLANLLHPSRHLEPVYLHAALWLPFHKDTIPLDEQVFWLFQWLITTESWIGLDFLILSVLVSHRPDHPSYYLVADIQRGQGIHCLSCSPIDAAGCHFGYRVQEQRGISLIR